MNSPSSSGDPRSGFQSEVDRLVSEYVERMISGEELDEEEIRQSHPTIASELLRHLRMFVSLGGDSDPVGALGDYTLRRQIGRGGMGVVYDAWQNSLERQVALKVLPAGVAADRKSFLRFMREAKTAAQLNHQNIVSVYGLGIEANTPYFAMITGQSPPRSLRS